MHTNECATADVALMSTRDLLAVVFGHQADDLLDACNGEVGRVLLETRAPYTHENRLLQAAIELARRASLETLKRTILSSPAMVKEYLVHHFLARPWESFVTLWLDAQNGLIACDELFRGTLTQTSVFPREVVRTALYHNAAGVILSHNHPSSGVAEPSRADELLTRALKDALRLIDVRVLDHIIVAGSGTTSFAERGLL